jgi:hypothetical protein
MNTIRKRVRLPNLLFFYGSVAFNWPELASAERPVYGGTTQIGH